MVARKHVWSQDKANYFRNHIRNVQAASVSTATGLVIMDHALTVEVNRLEGLLANVLVFPGSPALMSAGLLSSRVFLWAYGFLPRCVACDAQKIIVFDVCGGLPMIIEGGVFDKVHDLGVLVQLCAARLTELDGKQGVVFP